MRFSAVVFDLFGTLVDYLTREEFGRAHAQIAAALSLPADRFREAWRGTLPQRDVGSFGSLEGDIRHVTSLLGLRTTPEQVEAAVRVRLEGYRRCLAPRDGALETLAALRERGLPIGVLSDCASEIPRLWPETALAPLVDAVLLSCEARAAKPDARLYRMVARRLGVEPEQCLYVGDGGGRELTGAAGAGMHAVLIRVPYGEEYDVHRRDGLDWAGPAIDHLGEVIALVGGGVTRDQGPGPAAASVRADLPAEPAGSSTHTSVRAGLPAEPAGSSTHTSVRAGLPTEPADGGARALSPEPRTLNPFLKHLPKVELHLHLEGAIPPETLLEVFRRQGNTEMTCLEDVLALYRHQDFHDFLAHFRTILQWLRDADDLEPITYDVLAGLARQNVRYAEVIFSPGALAHFHGLDLDHILDAIQRGYARARAEFGIEMGLILDLIRNMGVENGWNMARFAAGAQDRGVVGITLGGNERDFPAAPFAEVYRWARDQGLRTTAHAGEGAGPESVWDCIRLLEVERIGHGVRMEEEPALAGHVAEHGIAVECCPWSNVVTGAVESLEAHPVRRWFERGVPLSINSDDPTLFGTDVTRELARLQEVHRFTDREIVRLMAQAVEMSFLPEEGKARLRGMLDRYADESAL